MISQTRAQLEDQIAQLDREHADGLIYLERLEQTLIRLAAELERAKPAEEEYTRQHRQVSDEIMRVAARHGATVFDSGPNDVFVEAGRGGLAREVRDRIVALCRQRRALEADRQAWLQQGGRTVAGAANELQAATVARNILKGRLAEAGR